MHPTTTHPTEPTSNGLDTGARYRCLRGREVAAAGYRLCTLRERDIEPIRLWRNAQIDVLRQAAPISPPEQQRYYEEVIRPTFDAPRPKLILLSLLRAEECIGYCGLTNLDWDAKRAEISFLLDPRRVEDPALYLRDFSVCLELLSRTAFEVLGLHRLFAETYDVRPPHVAILESRGFVCEGRLREHVRVAGRWVDSLIHGLLAADFAPDAQLDENEV